MMTMRAIGSAAAAAVALSGLAGVGEAQAADNTWCSYKVTASALKIRSGPGTSYTAIGQKSKGYTALGSQQTKNGFRQYAGGWASSAHLQRVGGVCAVA